MTALAPQSSNRAPSATRADGTSKTIISQILANILAIVLRTKFRPAMFFNLRQQTQEFCSVLKNAQLMAAQPHTGPQHTRHTALRASQAHTS
jgi:hypothetical protein